MLKEVSVGGVCRLLPAAGVDEQHGPVDDGGQEHGGPKWQHLQQSGHQLHRLQIPDCESPCSITPSTPLTEGPTGIAFEGSLLGF